MLLVRKRVVRWAILIAALGVLGCLASGAARADLKITMHASIKSAAMQTMPPQMDSLMRSTLYISGKKFLLDTPIMSVLIDRGSKKIFYIYRSTKTYSVTPYDPVVAESMLHSGPGANLAAAGASFKVSDTGKTASFLGHKVRHYIVTTRMASGNGPGTSIKTDILAAQDLPAADLQAYSAMAAGGLGKVHVQGVPIRTVTSTSGGPAGAFSMTNEATSISTKPLPASVFSIPSGYTKSQGPPQMPGGGMAGMGGAPGQ